jgi:DNA-binding NarL/FixJ family response regulator
MTRVYLADAIRTERMALRLTLMDLNLEIAGESKDWSTVAAEVPLKHIHMLVADWDLLPKPRRKALDELRDACPQALVIVLISSKDVTQKEVAPVGMDVFISKCDRPAHVVERLKDAATAASL